MPFNILTIIKYLKKKSLSDKEMLQLVDNKANLLTYPELTEYNDIYEAMGPNKALILLFMTRNNYGHWVCLFERDNGDIEFFDSYAYIPDEELEFVPQNFREVSGQDYPHLTALLYQSGARIIYNDERLQKQVKDVATCGRHVTCRLIFRKLTLQQYLDLFKHTNGLSPDDIVTFLTSFI